MRARLSTIGNLKKAALFPEAVMGLKQHEISTADDLKQFLQHLLHEELAESLVIIADLKFLQCSQGALTEHREN